MRSSPTSARRSLTISRKARYRPDHKTQLLEDLSLQKYLGPVLLHPTTNVCGFLPFCARAILLSLAVVTFDLIDTRMTSEKAVSDRHGAKRKSSFQVRIVSTGLQDTCLQTAALLSAGAMIYFYNKIIFFFPSRRAFRKRTHLNTS